MLTRQSNGITTRGSLTTHPTKTAHIHVDKAGNTAKFWLNPIELARNIGFTAKELKEIRLLVETHQVTFTEAWHGYFGTKRG